MRRTIRFLVGISALAVLAACGDGAVSSNVTGVAATGLAIVGGSVSLKCVGDTATSSKAALTLTDGSYSIDVTGATLPCVARVAYTDSTGAAQTLHSVVIAPGNVNITPLTELMVAGYIGGPAATAYDNFDPVQAKTVTAAQVTALATAVRTYLANTLKVDVANLPTDFVGTKLKAKTATAAGDSFDGVLDALKVNLSGNNKKLSDLINDIVAASKNSANAGTAGYPASGSFTGKLSDGSACTVTVAADNSLSVSATTWAYTGSVTSTLDGNYYEHTNREMAPAVIYTGTRRQYGSRTGDSAAASASAPYINTYLDIDATSGKLIMASGRVTTDTAISPVAGKNFNFVCAGEAYPAGANVAASEFNRAAASRFLATSLVSTTAYTAPSAKNEACTFTVDASGNAAVNWAGFTSTNGKLDLPYNWLTAATDQGVNTAVYEIYYHKTSGAVVGQNSNGSIMINSSDTGTFDTFKATFQNTNNVKSVNVMANGYSSDPKSVNCSTANDPNAKWRQVAANVGTWLGSKNNTYKFGNNATCQLVVAADGSMTYTDTAAAVTTISSAAWTVTPPNIGAYFDFAQSGTYITFSMDFTGTTVSGGKPQAFFYKTGASTEYCDNMVKQ